MTAKRINRRRISRSVGHSVFRLPKVGPHFSGKVRGYCAQRGVSSVEMQLRPLPTQETETAHRPPDIATATAPAGNSSAAGFVHN
jgi:hypothetical protein